MKAQHIAKTLTCVPTIFLLSLLSGCGLVNSNKGELDRKQAESKINQYLNKSGQLEKAKSSCRLNPLLANKPEFLSLKSEPLCDHSIEVTGIQVDGDNSRLAETKITITARRETLQKWLSQMDVLEQRLRSLPSNSAYNGFIYLTNYVDPSDGKIYRLTGSPYPNESIDKSSQFQVYQDLRKAVQKRLDIGSESHVQMSKFSLYDDGWRFQAPSN